jgi:hypothetical protein
MKKRKKGSNSAESNKEKEGQSLGTWHYLYSRRRALSTDIS